MKLNVYGQQIEIIRKDEQWIVFYLGNEGKKRLANDIIIPTHVKEELVIEYVIDLCHEWATPNNSEVTIIN